VDAPDVRFAKSGDTNIAYAAVGDGPFDLVFVNGWVLSALEYAWEGPAADFFRELASFSRLMLFDKRGTGLSDRTAGIPDLETRMDDIRAVMDAAGSNPAAIMGFSEGGPMTLLFAATYPERTAAAVLYGCRASYVAADDYPWGFTPEQREESVREEAASAGTDEWLDEWLEAFAPSKAKNDAVRQWWRRLVLTSASPGAVVALRRMNMEIDAAARAGCGSRSDARPLPGRRRRLPRPGSIHRRTDPGRGVSRVVGQGPRVLRRPRANRA
jgi:pimeloyl-ACP methyl ester carboxylesterase